MLLDFEIALASAGEHGWGGVDSGDARACPGQVQGETALVGADVQGFAMGVTGCCGVVQALVEEGPGLLPGVGVVVKGEPVEVKDGLQLRPGAAAILC